VTRLLTVLAAALALALVPATAALAAFRAVAASGTTVSTDTLAPPANPVNGSTCNLLTQNVSVSWTASTSTRIAGYHVDVTVNGGTTTYTQTGTTFSRFMLLGSGRTYTVAVRAYLGNWTSGATSITLTC
jgi:hypothetical protein